MRACEIAVKKGYGSMEGILRTRNHKAKEVAAALMRVTHDLAGRARPDGLGLPLYDATIGDACRWLDDTFHSALQTGEEQHDGGATQRQASLRRARPKRPPADVQVTPRARPTRTSRVPPRLRDESYVWEAVGGADGADGASDRDYDPET